MGRMQITEHLPLLATVTDAESVIASLKAGGAAGAGSDQEDA
jgi:hypothetical protein